MEIKALAGSYETIAHKFGQSFLCILTTPQEAQDVIAKDFHRTNFLGNAHEFKIYKFKWNLPNESYSQGNICCAFPSILLINREYQKSVQQNALIAPEQLKFHTLSFGYINKNMQACGISLAVDHHHPRVWVLGIMRNNNAPLKERHVFLYAGPDYALEHTKNISWKTMISNLVSDINAPTISPIIRALFKADGTINMNLFHDLDENFFTNHDEHDSLHSNHVQDELLHTNRTLDPVVVTNKYYNQQTTLTTLNAQAIIGCNRYIEKWISGLPHNKSARQTIIDLESKLKMDSKNTTTYLQHYFNTYAEIDTSISATSCLLIAIAEHEILPYALDLVEFTVDDLKNSKESRDACRIKIVQSIKQKLSIPQSELSSDDERILYYDY